MGDENEKPTGRSKVPPLEGYGLTCLDGTIIIFTQFDWAKMEMKGKMFKSREELEDWAKNIKFFHEPN